MNHFSNDHIDTITKVNVRTTNYLLDYLNASRSFAYANTWGYQYNNTWNGLSGYLVRGDVEIGGKENDVYIIQILCMQNRIEKKCQNDLLSS